MVGSGPPEQRLYDKACAEQQSEPREQCAHGKSLRLVLENRFERSGSDGDGHEAQIGAQHFDRMAVQDRAPIHPNLRLRSIKSPR